MLVPRICKGCGIDFLALSKNVKNGYGNYCSKKCTLKYNRTPGPLSKDHKMKLSEASKAAWSKPDHKFKTGDEQSKLVGEGYRKKRRVSKKPSSIYNLSSRTKSKIILRLKLGCFNCGWIEGPSDLHHINGRKIPNPHHHGNLTLLCPNCHRLAHMKKITIFETFEEVVGDKWLECYYGW